MPLLFYLYNIYNHIRPWGKYGHDAVGSAPTIAHFPAGLEQQANNRTNSACSALPLLFHLYTYTMHMRSRQVRARHSSVPTNDHKLPRRPRTASQQSHAQRLQRSAPTLLPLYTYKPHMIKTSTGTTQLRSQSQSYSCRLTLSSKPAIAPTTLATTCPYSSTSIHIQPHMIWASTGMAHQQRKPTTQSSLT